MTSQLLLSKIRTYGVNWPTSLVEKNTITMHVNLDISLFSPQYSLDAYPQCSFRSGPSPVTRVAKGLTGWLT